MNESTIVTRYAKALFELSKERNILEDIKNDVAKILNLCKNKELKNILQSPTIKSKKKIKVFVSLLTNYIVRKDSLAFINLLVKNNRENLLADIARKFLHQYKKEKNIKTIYIASVSPISKNTEKKIFNALSENLDANIEIKKKIDKSLIGGLIIGLDNYQYDLSVKNELFKIKNTLLKGG